MGTGLKSAGWVAYGLTRRARNSAKPANPFELDISIQFRNRSSHARTGLFVRRLPDDPHRTIPANNNLDLSRDESTSR